MCLLCLLSRGAWAQTDDVCHIVSDAYRKVFSSRADVEAISALEIAASPVKITDALQDPRIHWLSWEPVQGFEGRGVLLSATVNVNDRPSKLYAHAREHSWRGDIYNIYMPENADPDAIKKVLQKSDEGEGLQQIFPHHGNYGWIWANIFEHDGHYYYIDDPGTLSEPIREIYRIESDHTVSSQCKFSLYEMMDAQQQKSRLPAYTALLEYMDSMGGSGYLSCGTLNAHGRAKGEGNVVANRVLYRPWAMENERSPRRNPRAVEPLLQAWALGSPWDNRVYQGYQSALQPATQELADYYVHTLNIDQNVASAMAESASSHLNSAYFNHWGQLPINPFQVEIRQKLLAGALIDWAQPQLADMPMADEYEIYTLNSIISLAIDREENFDEIIKRWPLDSIRNHYGKTPLMYAAHLNHYSAVKKLLALGANVNAVTQSSVTGTDCIGTPRIQNRTPLMYAAENASVEVIKALVDAGANLDAKDSEGNGLDIYLEKNPRFDADQKRAGLKALVEQARATASPISPSFPCEKAGNRLEKRICDDETSSLYDRELAVTYLQMVNASKNPTFVRDDQRQWLKQRKSACLAFADDLQITACIRQMTRARIDYYFKRLY